MPDVVFRRRATFERGYAQVRVLGGLDRHGEGPSAICGETDLADHLAAARAITCGVVGSRST